MTTAQIHSTWGSVSDKGVCPGQSWVTCASHPCYTRLRNVSSLNNPCARTHVQPQRKKEKGWKREKSRAGEVDEQEEEGGGLICCSGMLYADGAGIVSRSPGRLQEMMTVIATACSVFGLLRSRRSRRRSRTCKQRVRKHVLRCHCNYHPGNITIEFVHSGLGYWRR